MGRQAESAKALSCAAEEKNHSARSFVRFKQCFQKFSSKNVYLQLGLTDTVTS